MANSTASLHALIIEDELLVAMEVEQLLEDLGYASCDIAACETDALDCAARRRPDLVTVDLRIIGGSGADAIEALIKRMGRIPYLFVTANADTLMGRTEAPIVDKPISVHAFNRACELACA